jgi:hypothetical protein
MADIEQHVQLKRGNALLMEQIKVMERIALSLEDIRDAYLATQERQPRKQPF